MARVAVTGAAGNVGRETVDALSNDHDVTPITHREREGLDSVILDVRDGEELTAAFEGHDVVVHLAANPDPGAGWQSVYEVNIGGTYNVYEAALSAGVDRVVFASTNHVHQMYNIADPARPETLAADARTVRPSEPPRPDSYYGVSKVFGEALGSYYADRYGIEVVNVRIGWLLSPEEVREKDDEEPAVARYVRAMWLSPRDCRQGMRRAVEAALPQSPLAVNLLSANDDRYLPLTEAMRALGYRPRDNSGTVVD
ncbi:NAD(P)-dependent oxidoreductase [Salinigranum rubrum]|uniref:NAD(P)-dependent oxidoreductase n=1 Tax=Salinigranum rubrum TaxID=755307 RepID=A0A2I8VPH1_9EURY|nr:NAD(P)-dependent oxidoreductase [Salinigranum rubrum]AUV83840.1 NAD(P)-dependent oxidoreductase [Salinigranum rubrum]